MFNLSAELQLLIFVLWTQNEVSLHHKVVMFSALESNSDAEVPEWKQAVDYPYFSESFLIMIWWWMSSKTTATPATKIKRRSADLSCHVT